MHSATALSRYSPARSCDGRLPLRLSRNRGSPVLASETKCTMVAPLAVVGDVHSFLALGVGLHDGAIGIQDRLIEKLVRLLSPDPQPRIH